MALEYREVEAADADMIASEDKPSVSAVPDGACERPPQAFERARSPAIVCVRDEFRVGAHREAVTTAFQRVAQFARIDQLRIGHRSDVACVARPDTCF